MLKGGVIGFGMAGVVFIDLHEGVDTAQFTADEIQEIVNQVDGVQTPAYEVVVLGYFNSSGQYIIYENGIIQ